MRLRIIATLERTPYELCDIDYMKAQEDCKEIPKLQEVELKDLVAVQGTVDFDQHERDYQRSLKNPEAYTGPVQNLRDHPVVVHIEDKYIILDGHHRTTKALKEGKSSIACYVFERPLWHLIRPNISGRLRVQITDVNSYINDILEMYENCNDKQARKFNALVDSYYAILSWEDFRDRLQVMREEDVIAMDLELQNTYDLEEEGLIERELP